MSTIAEQVPTVYVRIGPSACAYDEGGEIIETVDFNEDGTPDWSSGGVADGRGGGEGAGFRLLASSLTDAEENASLVGYDVKRLPRE